MAKWGFARWPVYKVYGSKAPLVYSKLSASWMLISVGNDMLKEQEKLYVGDRGTGFKL